jgi:hypothetical protein
MLGQVKSDAAELRGQRARRSHVHDRAVTIFLWNVVGFVGLKPVIDKRSALFCARSGNTNGLQHQSHLRIDLCSIGMQRRD